MPAVACPASSGVLLGDSVLAGAPDAANMLFLKMPVIAGEPAVANLTKKIQFIFTVALYSSTEIY